MSHFQIGWAEYSLTPDKKVSLVGQFAERISEYVEKPLCVTAMAVSTDSDQAVFCSCDLVGVSWRCATPCAKSSRATPWALTR